MPNRNTLGKAVFEIGFVSEEDAFEQQASLSPFIHANLMPILDELLSSHSLHGYVIRIGNLEIDLGTIRCGNFQEEMEARFREELDAVLREKIRLLRPVHGSGEGIISQNSSDFELVEHFLLTGIMPWKADLKEELPLDRILLSLLTSDRNGFLGFLKKYGWQQRIRRRLVRQFPEEILAEIVGLVDPLNARFITDYVKRMRNIQKATPFMTAGEAGFGHIIWDSVLDNLLKHSGEVFSKKTFIMQTMEQLVRGQDIEVPQLLSISVAAGDRTCVSSAVDRILSDLIADWMPGHRQEQGDASSIVDGVEENPEPGELRALKKLLVDAMVHGAPIGFDAGWERLVREYPAQARETILRYGKTEEIRRRIPDLFSQRQLRELIHLIEPAHGRLVGTLCDTVAGTGAEKRLLDFMLVCVCENGGRALSTRELVRGAVMEAACHDPGTYGNLLGALGDAVTGGANHGAWEAGTAALVSELRDEFEREALLRKDHDEESKKIFRGYDLYEALGTYLRYGRRQQGALFEGEERSISEIIEELGREYPGHLLHLFKELHAGPGHITRVTANLSADLLERLIFAYLSLTCPGGGDHPSDLIRGIAGFADKAGDRHKYYGSILDSIIHGRIIDLEEAVTQGENAEKDPGRVKESIHEPFREGHRVLDVHGSSDEEPSAPKYPDQGLENRLFEYLRGGMTVGEEDLPPLGAYFESMLVRSPERLYRCIGGRPLSGETARRLTGLVPAGVLTRVVHLLSPLMYRHYQRCADIIWNAYYPEAHGRGTEGFERRKWEFLLSFPGERRVIGRDENAFVMGFIEYLAEKDGMDGSELLSMVSQRLAREIPPVARQDHLSVMEILSGISSRIRGHDRDRAEQESGERGPGRGMDRAVPGSPVPVTDTGPCGFESLKKLLVDAMVHGAPIGFDAGWERLVREYPAQARETILRYGKTEEIRRRIPDLFSERQLRELIHLIEPAHGRLVGTLCDTVAGTGAEKMLLDFMLVCVCENGGRALSTRELVRGAVMEAACHDPGTYGNLLGALGDAVTGGANHGAWEAGTAALVSELRDEFEREALLRKDHDEESKKIFRGYDLYEALGDISAIRAQAAGGALRG